MKCTKSYSSNRTEQSKSLRSLASFFHRSFHFSTFRNGFDILLDVDAVLRHKFSNTKKYMMIYLGQLEKEKEEMDKYYSQRWVEEYKRVKNRLTKDFVKKIN